MFNTNTLSQRRTYGANMHTYNCTYTHTTCWWFKIRLIDFLKRKQAIGKSCAALRKRVANICIVLHTVIQLYSNLVHICTVYLYMYVCPMAFYTIYTFSKNHSICIFILMKRTTDPCLYHIGYRNCRNILIAHAKWMHVDGYIYLATPWIDRISCFLTSVWYTWKKWTE